MEPLENVQNLSDLEFLLHMIAFLRQCKAYGWGGSPVTDIMERAKYYNRLMLTKPPNNGVVMGVTESLTKNNWPAENIAELQRRIDRAKNSVTETESDHTSLTMTEQGIKSAWKALKKYEIVDGEDANNEPKKRSRESENDQEVRKSAKKYESEHKIENATIKCEHKQS